VGQGFSPASFLGCSYTVVTDRDFANLLQALMSKFLPTEASEIVVTEMGHDGIHGGVHSQIQYILQMKVNGIEQIVSDDDSSDASDWS